MKELTEIKAPIVAIVHFQSEENIPRRQIYYQITIDPEAFTEGGFVRFGQHDGDEITGWQPANDIVIDEILHERVQLKEREQGLTEVNIGEAA